MPQLEDFFGSSASRAELARLKSFSTIHQSRAERMANGKAIRRNLPRSSHAAFRHARDRPDPVSILQAQNATRIKELVPVRMARTLSLAVRFPAGKRGNHGGRSRKFSAH